MPTTIKLAIRTRDADKVKAFLAGLPEDDRKTSLTTKYGGRGDSKFADSEGSEGLHGETLPILDAALTGDGEIFVAIATATTEAFGVTKVVWLVSARVIHT